METLATAVSAEIKHLPSGRHFILRLYCISPSDGGLPPPPFLHFPGSFLHDGTMSPDGYSFRTELVPTPPQTSADEGSLRHSRSEAAGQRSRKPHTPLNEMVKRRGFHCLLHTRKLREWWGQRSPGIAGL